MAEINGKAVVVYSKKKGLLTYLRVFDYEKEEQEAQDKFKLLLDDSTLDDVRMCTIERFSECLLDNKQESYASFLEWFGQNHGEYISYEDALEIAAEFAS